MIEADSLMVHGTCVALSAERAVLITGPSGRGKSGLALALLSMGATLVSDDQTLLTQAQDGSGLLAKAPDTIRGLIEARGIGLLKAETLDQAVVVGVVDMTTEETQRLPEHRTITYLGKTLPKISFVDGPYFAASVLQWLKEGRAE